MKSLVRSVGVMLIVVIATTVTMAQPEGKGPKEGMGFIEKIKDKLTEEQKAMLEANKKKNQEMRDAFRATLTDAQKAILESTELKGKEKRDAFRATLTDDQLGLMESHKATRKAQMEAFRATLTDEQKAMIKKAQMAKNQRIKQAMMKRKHAAKNAGN